MGCMMLNKRIDDGFESNQQQGLARDDARNEYHVCRSTWVCVAAAATNGEGHADADAERYQTRRREM